MEARKQLVTSQTRGITDLTPLTAIPITFPLHQQPQAPRRARLPISQLKSAAQTKCICKKQRWL